jgi:hypothetical protein
VEKEFPVEKMITRNASVLVKSKHRVQKHGEVFTPQWVVDKMIAIPGIREKIEDVFATFLEPSAGEGAFLLAIEDMKLQFVSENYSKEEWDCYALWVLTSIYGIEFLEDNLAIARQNMLDLFADYYKVFHGSPLPKRSDLYRSAQTIIWANVVQGNALTHLTLLGEEITFSQWERVPDTLSKVHRKPFAYSSLFIDEKNSQSVQLSLFEPIEQLSIFSLNVNGQEKASRLQRYKIVAIEQVWKEEKENG